MANKIGSLYNAKNVVVGQAAGFFAPVDTAMPADSSTLFDTTLWQSTAISVGAASAGSIDIKTTGGPAGTTVTASALGFGATATAIAAALQALLPAGYTVTATGTLATSVILTIDGPGAEDIVITAVVNTALTGGALLVVPPAWSAAGATEQGWQVNYNPQTQKINIEEQPTPVANNVSTADYQFVANLSEDTVKSLQLALNATATVQAADTTHVGKTRLQLQPDLVHRAVVLETNNKYGLPRRYYIPDCTVAANVGQNFRRASAARLIPVTFESVCDLSRIVIDEVSAPHT